MDTLLAEVRKEFTREKLSVSFFLICGFGVLVALIFAGVTVLNVLFGYEDSRNVVELILIAPFVWVVWAFVSRK